MGVFRIRLFKQEETLTYSGQHPPFLRPRNGEQLPKVTHQTVAEPNTNSDLSQLRALCFTSALLYLTIRGHSWQDPGEDSTSPRMLTHTSWAREG